MDQLMSKIASVIPTLQGWCTVEKAQWLARWIVEKKCTEVVEIGVFGGRSLIPMAMGIQHLDQPGDAWHGRVTGIDAYTNSVAEAEEKDFANRDWWAKIDLRATQKAATEAVISHRLGAIVKLLFCSSSDAVVRFDDDTIDLVHVDGSHNEVASTRDVKMWWPKVKPGGVMVMDDTDWNQLKPARELITKLGKLVHHDDKWEVYQKAVYKNIVP